MKRVLAVLFCCFLVICLSSCIIEVHNLPKFYDIGDRGPADGYVFYDKGDYSNGWRYLEVIPSSIQVPFGYYRNNSSGDNLYVNGYTVYNSLICTKDSVGEGESNTQLLIGSMGSYAYSLPTGSDKTYSYAAKVCADYEYNGFDDWYLPSLEELNTIYEIIVESGTASFPEGFYWSSTEYEDSADFACLQHFGNKYESKTYFYGERKEIANICLVRSF